MAQHNSSHRNHPRLLLIVAVVLLSLSTPVLAYLDPTTGSMLISAIVGLFASLVLAIRNYWYRIKAFFKARPADTDTDDGAV
jgi:putative flippase GtrA